MLRMKLIPYRLRVHSNKLLVKHCKEDGMTWARRKIVYAGVSTPVASRSAKPGRVQEPPILVAP